MKRIKFPNQQTRRFKLRKDAQPTISSRLHFERNFILTHNSLFFFLTSQISAKFNGSVATLLNCL